MPRRLLYIFIPLFAFHSFLFAANNNEVHIEKKPEWTVRLEPDLQGESEQSAEMGGVYFILLDKQTDVQSRAVFRHIVVKITGFEGINYMSDISVDFDPVYQKVGFHKLIVHRNGERINKLDDHEIKTFQREVEMDRKLYDGSLTAVINLRDIRLGDVIEYEYTVTGINPVYKDYFDSEMLLEFAFPVHRNYARMLVPINANVQIAYPFGEVLPEIIRTSNSTEYVWDQDNPKPLLLDNNVPFWYNPFKKAIISNFSDWGSVVNLMMDHYSISSTVAKELKAEISDAFKDEDTDQLITRIIRFVQDEIRYLGFESGISAYKPHLPTQVLSQRFGDCKDKSLLLCAILHRYDIQAYPVFVSSLKAYNIEESLPSLSVFNHVIVQIKNDGKTRYIDPSISHQGGIWENIYIPDYRVGLVIKKGSNELTYLPESDLTTTVISETFDVEMVGGNAKYSIVTEYYGADADFQRSVFYNSSLDYLEKTFIDYYSNLYPNITTSEPLQLEDSREIENHLTVKESYSIENFWETEEDKPDLFYCNFYASELEYEIGLPQSASRTMPYYISHPVDIYKMTELNLPEEWIVEKSNDKIRTDDFVYESEVVSYGNKITLMHRYKTHSDHVPAIRFKEYQSKVNHINDNLNFQVTSYNLNNGASNISWFAVIVAIFTLISGAIVSVSIYKKYSPAPKNKVITYTRSLGGWLVLIGIGLSILPLSILYGLFTHGSYFDASVWRALIDPDSGIFSLSLVSLLLGELIYNTFLFVYIILLLILFFKRRTSFPRLIIIYFIAQTIFITIDSFIAFNITEIDGITRNQLIATVIRSFILAAIWVPYFIFSERVEDTFTVEYNQAGV